MADGMTLSRVITKELLHCGQTPSSLRGEVLGADTTGPAVARIGIIQLDWITSAYCPKGDQFVFRKPKGTELPVGVGHQMKAMEYPTLLNSAGR